MIFEWFQSYLWSCVRKNNASTRDQASTYPCKNKNKASQQSVVFQWCISCFLVVLLLCMLDTGIICLADRLRKAWDSCNRHKTTKSANCHLVRKMWSGLVNFKMKPTMFQILLTTKVLALVCFLMKNLFCVSGSHPRRFALANGHCGPIWKHCFVFQWCFPPTLAIPTVLHCQGRVGVIFGAHRIVQAELCCADSACAGRCCCCCRCGCLYPGVALLPRFFGGGVPSYSSPAKSFCEMQPNLYTLVLQVCRGGVLFL